MLNFLGLALNFVIFFNEILQELQASYFPKFVPAGNRRIGAAVNNISVQFDKFPSFYGKTMILRIESQTGRSLVAELGEIMV